MQLRGKGTLVTGLFSDEMGNYLDLTQLPADVDVPGELRKLNARHGTAMPCLWSLVVEFDEDDTWGRWPSVWLEAGFAGPRGVLIWADRSGKSIPASGKHRLRDEHDWLPYFDWSGTECGVRGAASVPVEQVFAAVREVVSTRRRPTVVEMVEIDAKRYPMVGPRQDQHSSTYHRTA